jgi:multiple sugar transport system permease protein
VATTASDPTRHFFQPIIVCLTVASVALTLFVIWISLHDLSLMRAGREKFVGLDNYLRFFGDPRAMAALWRTVLFTTLATVIEIALGLAVVLFLDRDFAMKRLVRTLLLVPIIMTPVASCSTPPPAWRIICCRWPAYPRSTGSAARRSRCLRC